MKIYIIGTGGLGGYFGGLLANSGLDVTFVAKGDSFQTIKENGLKIKSISGDFTIKPAKAINKISEIADPDLVLFTVKTYDTDETAKQLNPVTKKETVIITFQNGVDNDVRIKKYLDKAEVYPGVAYVISTKTAPGVITQTSGIRKLIIGDRKNLNNQKLKIIENIMKDANIDAAVSSDITIELWKKYVFILAFSGMTAVCRSPIGKILHEPTTKHLYEKCLTEAINVARSMKINISDDIFDSTMKLSKNMPYDSKSSLLIDIEQKRKNEIETLNGTLVKFAREININVPVNELIYGAIKLLA